MGCLKFYDEEYLRIKFKMGKNDENKKNSNQGRTFTEDEIEQIINKAIEKHTSLTTGKHTSSIIEKVERVVQIAGGILAVLVTIGGVVIGYVKMNENINSLRTDVNKLMSDSSEMKEYLYADDGVKDQLGMITEALNLKIINVTDENVSSSLEGASIEKNDISYSTSSFSAETCIGTDVNGNVYMADDLIGETILLTYKEDEKEVFFLGQYNENYHWDGYCVTNAYNSDNSLYGICESNFDDGQRVDFKSICITNENEWIYSNRICKKETNTGINIVYTIENKKIKNFTNTNVRINDILYVDDFIENSDTTMIQYYCGNTSQGLFDDDTGNAYTVKYYNDGTVKTLYVGRFSNGTFNDNSGYAWDIAYSQDYGFYVYNTGNFKNGNAEKKSTESISIEDINKIIAEYDFACELKWR